jgi:hypothetical protein
MERRLERAGEQHGTNQQEESSQHARGHGCVLIYQ